MRLKLFTKFTFARYELQREMIIVSFSEKVNSKTVISSLHIRTRIRTSLSSPPKLFPTQLKAYAKSDFVIFLLVSPLSYHKIPTIFGELFEPLNHCRCYCMVFLRHCISLFILFLPRMALSPVLLVQEQIILGIM